MKTVKPKSPSSDKAKQDKINLFDSSKPSQELMTTQAKRDAGKVAVRVDSRTVVLVTPEEAKRMTELKKRYSMNKCCIEEMKE